MYVYGQIPPHGGSCSSPPPLASPNIRAQITCIRLTVCNLGRHLFLGLANVAAVAYILLCLRLCIRSGRDFSSLPFIPRALDDKYFAAIARRFFIPFIIGLRWVFCPLAPPSASQVMNLHCTRHSYYVVSSRWPQ